VDDLMSVPISTEQRMLTAAEVEVVKQTHHPTIAELSQDALADASRRLRDYRDKARDVARQQRREMRGKASPRGAHPTRDSTGTSMKKQIFASALKRVSRELGRSAKAEQRAGQSEIARRALELKRANRVRHHPSAGRTAGHGMRAIPNPVPPTETDPRENVGMPEVGTG
jgi:t-SNARE complex subunit (syntaxin)